MTWTWRGLAETDEGKTRLTVNVLSAVRPLRFILSVGILVREPTTSGGPSMITAGGLAVIDEGTGGKSLITAGNLGEKGNGIVKNKIIPDLTKRNILK